MNWCKRHPNLSILFLITSGLYIWYAITDNGLAIIIGGGLWGLVVMSYILRWINHIIPGYLGTKDDWMRKKREKFSR